MSHHTPLSRAARWTIAALVAAAAGVAIQIASGAPYPRIPPVFFILLVPAALVAAGRWWWAPLLAVAGGLFLTVGLFAAGQAGRLVDPRSLGDTFGLWLQTVAVIVAAVAGAIATRTNLRRPSRVAHG